MDMLCIGALAGIVITALIFGCAIIGWESEEPQQSKMDAETAIISLQNLQMSLSKSERDAVDFAIRKLQEPVEKPNEIEQLANKLGVKLNG